jgi:coenzyme F420-reducing hydrogenase gamma subunit
MRLSDIEPFFLAGGLMAERRSGLAVWKFASCDGCRHLLDCEDELLGPDEVDGALPGGAAGDGRGPLRPLAGRGSITTAENAERIQQVRRASRRLVTIRACATAGGIQALRNFADSQEFVSAVCDARSTYLRRRPRPDQRPRPGRLRAPGLPDQQAPLLEVIGAFLGERGQMSPPTASASSASGAATSA